MGLNIARGNMYEFVTHTWNTVKGKCPHDCSYCYMKRFPQKEIRFDEKELKTDLGQGNFIFVGSSCDMWSISIPSVWIIDTLTKCNYYDNKYLFQSKNPFNMAEYLNDEWISKQCVVCTTIETNRWYPDIMGTTQTPDSRAQAMQDNLLHFEKYVTIEPILDFDLSALIDLISCCNPSQVNIGADSGNNHLPEPNDDKIRQLIFELSKFTKVVQKPNLSRLLA